ncbi:hypothetical protein D3C71_898110 [compost metagenome]
MFFQTKPFEICNSAFAIIPYLNSVKNTSYILNLLFLLALTILLLNDFYWKETYSNGFTGKLSDVSGLVVFTLFFSALLPNKFRTVLYLATALLFVWWKSAWSESFIESWNQTMTFYPLARTVDYSDLWCLLVLIPLYFYHPETNQKWIPGKWVSVPLLFTCLFAIVATSKAENYHSGPPYTYQIIESFKLKMTHAEFLENLSLSNIKVEKNPDAVQPKNPSDFHYYILRNFTMWDGLDIESMKIGIREKNKSITIGIEEVSVLTPPEESIKVFRKLIVEESEDFFSWGK